MSEFGSWLAESSPLLLAMCVLILLSALFSGSEAALFSLSTRDKKLLRRGGLGGQIATRLLEHPEPLLSAILFWNLLINMTYFSLAAILGSRLEVEFGRSQAVLLTAVSLLAIIFFSEMLPKSFAVLVPVRLSVVLAPPLSMAVRVVRPVLPIVTRANSAVGRLLWPSFQAEPEIDLTDIERAIELGTDDAALLQRERQSLRHLVQTAETRVGEWMRPRSKLWLCSEPIQRKDVIDQPIRSGYLMVMDQDEEMIVKAIGLRTLRPSQLDDLDGAAEPVIFVPWSALVSQVLDRLRDEVRSVAVVVNEFGELLGAISIDEIMQQILAPHNEDDLNGKVAITPTGPMQYRVWGLTSIRKLIKELGLEIDGEGVTTVAGYVGRHNERLARIGDSAPLDHFVLTVVSEDSSGVWIDVQSAAVDDEVTP
jgi:CBS domain containing-hemolysin-like protein